MQATNAVSPGLLDNDDRFTDPFFARFTLRNAPNPLELTDTISKQYRFPTFYSDVTCAIGIFLCDYERAQAILPRSNGRQAMKPVRMTLGRSLVVFSCYEYKNVMNVAPYNEISMMIPVQVQPALSVPLLPMLIPGLFPSFGYYVFHMPVTSKENQLRGNKLWGLPKVTQTIDVTIDANGECVTVAREANGEPYFELRVPTAGAATAFDVSANIYSMLEGRLLTSRTSFKAPFHMTKHMGLLLAKDKKPARPFLKLGNTESARMLRELQIEEHPFQLRFAQHMNAAFDLPHKIA